MTDIYKDWQNADEPVVLHAKIGERCRFAPFVTIGTEPFSFEQDVLPRQRKPVNGGVVIGDDVEIESHTNVDRGTERDTVIGDGTRVDRLVHIAHDSVIGKYCIIVAGTIVGGFVEMGDGVYCGMNVSIKPRVKIGAGSKIGAGAVVLKDVPPNSVMVGNPARFLRYNVATPGGAEAIAPPMRGRGGS
jgi:UDP-3-O-[3-hydroxymyristoyl] glucosamine N-acyltransferase